MRNTPTIVRVSDARICEIFNSSQHVQTIANGEYYVGYRKNYILPDATAIAKELPIGTRCRIRRHYRIDAAARRFVLMVEEHFYLLPDGTIGKSGRPSPKRVLIGDTMYRYDDRFDPSKQLGESPIA